MIREDKYIVMFDFVIDYLNLINMNICINVI